MSWILIWKSLSNFCFRCSNQHGQFFCLCLCLYFFIKVFCHTDTELNLFHFITSFHYFVVFLNLVYTLYIINIYLSIPFYKKIPKTFLFSVSWYNIRLLPCQNPLQRLVGVGCCCCRRYDVFHLWIISKLLVRPIFVSIDLWL